MDVFVSALDVAALRVWVRGGDNVTSDPLEVAAGDIVVELDELDVLVRAPKVSGAPVLSVFSSWTDGRILVRDRDARPADIELGVAEVTAALWSVATVVARALAEEGRTGDL